MMEFNFRFVREGLREELEAWVAGTLSTPNKIKTVKRVLSSLDYRTGHRVHQVGNIGTGLEIHHRRIFPE